MHVLSPRLVLSALVLFLSLPFTIPGYAQQTNNYLLRAVPAERPIVLDGRLEDWDLSGQILMCYDIDEMLERNSVRSAACYDSDYLYLAFHFADRSPMLNRVNPKYQPGSGWRSDCVQLRVWADAEKPLGPKGSRITHIDCYWYTPERRPVAYLTHHDMSRRQDGFEDRLPDAIGKGIDAAFRKDEDGKGYIQEMRVSWKFLRRDGRPYRAGEELRMGIECFWGDATAERWYEHRLTDLINEKNPQREFFWSNHRAWGKVQFLDHGHLAPSPSLKQLSKLEELRRLRYQTRGPVPIKYELPHDGFVTLVIETPDGTRVRNLIGEYPRKAGKNVDFWDGADDGGRLVIPGKYRVRGLFRDEFDLKYQFSYGSAGDPPWPTSDGKGSWLSDHSMPVAAAADSEKVYFSAFFSEAGTTVIGCDLEGRRQWGMPRISGGMLARQGKYLYVLAGGNHPTAFRPGELRLIRIDPDTGKFASFPNRKNEVVIFEYPKDRKVAERLPEGAAVEKHAYNADWCRHEAMGLAAARKRLFVSLFYENKVLCLNPEDGSKVAEYPLERPVGLAADRQDNLYAISGTRVVRLDGKGQAVPVVTKGLEAPIGLATDASGNLYVSDWGSQMCVKVFSPRGKKLRTIGRVGGRPLLGKFHPKGFFRPWGLAVDANNRLWVVEYDRTPKRISVWTTRGKFLDEFTGPGWYKGTENNVNTLDPRRAISLGNILKLDWRHGRWRVIGTLWRPTRARAWFGPRGEGLYHQVVKVKRRQLLVSSKSPGYLCFSELKKFGARPLVALGHIREFLSEGGDIPDLLLRHLWDDPKMLEWAKQRQPDLFTGNAVHRHRLLYDIIWRARNRGKPMRTEFIWTDANGDALVQDAEVQFFAPEEAGGLVLGGPWRFAVGRDLTLYPTTNHYSDRFTWAWRLPVNHWNKAGAPVYDIKDARRIVHEKPQWFLNSAWVDSRGSLLLNHSPMQMFSKEGKLLWRYPNQWPGVHGSHKAPKERRGLLIGPLKVIGSAELGNGVGEIFCLSGNLGKAFFMTTDGLYVGSLFKDTRSAPDSLPDRPVRGMSIRNTSAGSEWFGGEFFKNILDDRIYLGSSALNAVELCEVTGLDTVRRLPGEEVTFTEEAYAQAREFLLAERKEAEKEKRIEIHSPKKDLKGLAPQFYELDWRVESRAAWNFDGHHEAQATWSFDKNYLYIVFRDVLDDTPMINHGADRTRLFKTGDACLLELRTQPGDTSGKVLPGDLRLLFSVFEKKPVAVVYRYKVPGTKRPFEFGSPVTVTKVDVVKVLESARVVIQRERGRYTLRAAVRLSDLAFRPEQGKTYRGDFGIVYSDKLGQTNSLRMNWSNLFTSMISDLALESTITPKYWGVFEVKGARKK